jgi:folate-binding protein YgfZ
VIIMTGSLLLERLDAANAQWMEWEGSRVPASFGSVEEEYWAVKEAAGLLDLSRRGRLLVSGKDAQRFLHGQTTADIKQMPVGGGSFAFFLNVHGHILADARILRLDEQTFLIDTEPQRLAAIRATLQQHIIADRVELRDEGDARGWLALEGPCTLEVLRDAVGFDPPHMLLLQHLVLPDLSLRLVRTSLTGEFGFWIDAPAAQLAGIWDRCLEAGRLLGVRPVGFDASEICRIENGIPRYGADINEKTFSQETGQMHAVSFNKGCYLGQEVVERIRSRGHVNRKLMGLLFEGPQHVSHNAEIVAQGQPAGTITSVAYSFGLRRTIALAMLRRESAEPGTSVTVAGLPAEVTSLPFFYPMVRSYGARE